MTEPSTLGELIRERRLARGLSLGQLATAVGRTAATVRAWERNQHAPAAQIVDRLAEVLEIDAARLNELAGAEEDTEEDEAREEETPSPPSSPQPEAVLADEPEPAAIVPDEPEAAAEISVSDEHAAEATAPSNSLGSHVEVEAAADPPEDAEVEVGDVLVGDHEAGDDDLAPAFVADVDELQVIPRIDPKKPPAGPADNRPTMPPVATERPRIGARPLAEEPTEAIETPVAPAAGPPVPTGTRASAQATAPTALVGSRRTAAVAAVTLSEPPLPKFLGALRVLFDPQKRWLYWIRATLTIAVLMVLGAVLFWALGELFTSLGDVLDSIEPTDSIQSDLTELDV